MYSVKSEVEAEMTKAPTVTEDVKPVVASVTETKSELKQVTTTEIKPLPVELKDDEPKPDVDAKK